MRLPAAPPAISARATDEVDGHKKRLPPQGGLASQDAEGSTIIGEEGEVEKAWNDLPAFIQRKISYNPPLAQLIRHHSGEKDQGKEHISFRQVR